LHQTVRVPHWTAPSVWKVRVKVLIMWVPDIISKVMLLWKNGNISHTSKEPAVMKKKRRTRKLRRQERKEWNERRKQGGLVTIVREK
jgi:hypothetical protein